MTNFVKEKPSMVMMRALEPLYRNQAKYITSYSVLSTQGIEYNDATGRKLEGNEYPENLTSTTTTSLLQSGWIVKSKKPEGHVFAWYDHPYHINAAGRAIFEKHYAEYTEWRERLMERNKATERLIIIKIDERFPTRHRKYGGLCKVVRETNKRCYVEVIQIPSTYASEIHGHGNNVYVDKADITMDNVTLGMFQRLRDTENDYLRWKDERDQEMEAELAEIRDKYAQRDKQRQAQLDDEFNEVVRNNT